MLFLREMSLSRCKWKSMSKVYENKTEHEQLQGKGGYVADLEIHRSMELQGAVEVVLNREPTSNCAFQTASSSCSLRRNSKGTPDWIIIP